VNQGPLQAPNRGAGEKPVVSGSKGVEIRSGQL